MTERVRQRQYLSKNSVLPAWSVSFRNDPTCPIGVREDLAKNMVAEVAVRDAKVRNDFDRVSIFKRPIFNATWNDKLGRWEDFVAQGEAGFTLTPPVKHREVIYRCQPFWYRLEQGDQYGPVFVSVAAQPLEGYQLAPMFKNGTDYVWRPSFELALDASGTPRSRAGLKPIEGSAKEIMSIAKSYSKNARVETTAEWFSDYLLLLVEFGRRDLHNVMHGYWGREIYLDTYHDLIDDQEYFSFSTYNGPPCAINEQCLLCYADYRESNSSKTRLVTLYHVTYLEDGLCLLDFGLPDLEDLINECIEFSLKPMPMNTGYALANVTAATSGTAGESTDAIASIVWRGKENPWGNAGSFMCDMIFQVKDGRLFFPYHLDDLSRFDGTLNEHYVACSQNGYSLPAYATHFLTAYRQSDLPHVLIPSSYTLFNPEKYWSTSMRIDTSTVGSIKFLRMGGNSRSPICVNHGTFELLEVNNAGNALGGRLVLEGGGA